MPANSNKSLIDQIEEVRSSLSTLKTVMELFANSYIDIPKDTFADTVRYHRDDMANIVYLAIEKLHDSAEVLNAAVEECFTSQREGKAAS